jgi:hypothetical protein
VLSLAIGSTLGVIAGFYQGGSFGFVDDLLMWGIITLNSIPGFFLLLIISAMLDPTVWSLILILAFLSWTGTMRFVRGETLSQRSREYIVAAQANRCERAGQRFRPGLYIAFGVSYNRRLAGCSAGYVVSDNGAFREAEHACRISISQVNLAGEGQLDDIGKALDISRLNARLLEPLPVECRVIVNIAHYELEPILLEGTKLLSWHAFHMWVPVTGH